MTGVQQPVRIAPSILAADFARLGEEVRAIDKAGCDWVHIDVMDGHFVPNLTLGPPVIAALRPVSTKPFDVHLMIRPVEPLLDAFLAAGADIVTVHVEAVDDIRPVLQRVRTAGAKAGVSLKPATPPTVASGLLDIADLVLVMSVEPGFGGQAFDEAAPAKIAALRAMIDRSGRTIDLEVDGGIVPETAGLAVAAGADVLVAGTAAFHGEPETYPANIAALRESGT